jgi:hypothetical protein
MYFYLTTILKRIWGGGRCESKQTKNQAVFEMYLIVKASKPMFLPLSVHENVTSKRVADVIIEGNRHCYVCCLETANNSF